MAATIIATWFVGDTAEDATFFPQVVSRSDDAGAQAVYWRCTVAFYASSLAVNPDARHVFYTNGPVPVIDGFDCRAALERWGVEIVTLPISWRLPRGSVGSWGNQFYVFDVIAHVAASDGDDRLILLDSDCIWRQPVGGLEAAIDRHGALTYELGHDEHPEGEAINGLTREGLASFVARHGGEVRSKRAYFGGEIYAASAETNRRVAELARKLWPDVVAQADDSPREEAHLLSAIYALLDIAPGTANAFIRRMWTTFRHNNLRDADADLAIWHLPAEKRTGFADLFAAIIVSSSGDPRVDAGAMGLTEPTYRRLFGFPRRYPRKFARDLTLKIMEKIRS
ncbi:hypothetical protein [Croceicoccus ponticola]|uniref:hypothetical protein n=1 Tax=Croceicoccus ponticola TaxID=2217664 RepID=UPI0013E2C77E|nr:hypothetical protein [Croceicoccus ponticola]